MWTHSQGSSYRPVMLTILAAALSSALACEPTSSSLDLDGGSCLSGETLHLSVVAEDSADLEGCESMWSADVSLEEIGIYPLSSDEGLSVDYVCACVDECGNSTETSDVHAITVDEFDNQGWAFGQIEVTCVCGDANRYGAEGDYTDGSGKGGCSCAAPGSGAGLPWMLVGLLGAFTRRRSQATC